MYERSKTNTTYPEKKDRKRLPKEENTEKRIASLEKQMRKLIAEFEILKSDTRKQS